MGGRLGPKSGWGPSLWMGVMYVVGTLPVFLAVQTYLPDAYMDEWFHFPQTLRFCQGDSTWDAGITTLPGLYLVAAIWSTFLSLFSASESPCSLRLLRSTNLAMGFGIVLVSYWVATHLHPLRPSYHNVLRAVCVAFIPFLWFFFSLYYTDPGALLWVLLCYLGVLKQRYGWSAMAGGLSILFRQTNAVWVAFVAGVALLRLLATTIDPRLNNSASSIADVAHLHLLLLRAIRHRWIWLVRRLWPLGAVIVGFVVFVVWNGGVVVGDRSHHTAVLHVPQLLYFFSCASALLAPTLFRTTLDDLQWMKRHWWGLVILCGMAWMAIAWFSLEHPFLLADNRHYTFYLWRWILHRNHIVPFLLLPVHVAATVIVIRRLAATQATLWVSAWLVCTSATLVPTALLELRYFVVPLSFFLLHIEMTTISLATTCTLFVLINTITMFVFVMRPFEWSDSSTARFMW